MDDITGFAFLALAFLIVAAAVLWAAGEPKKEPREHLRIREALDGGKLHAVKDTREAA